MLTETVSRRLDALATISKEGKRINGLFRLMEHPLLWYEAYANINSNAGAITRGVDGITLDGFSQARVVSIITRLKDGTYRFKPTRRVYIPKANGKKRPLGVPSGDDKLVQEVIRLILERIYEPVFQTSSHGYRPGRSPHTALEQIGQQWTSVTWIIDMDIQSFFDTIDHAVMIAVLEKKIDDVRFITLIRAMLRAGYVEDWRFHGTYSGTPQGGIASPILANVYLHELDLFMQTMKESFNQGNRRRKNKLYHRYTERIDALRKKGDRLRECGAPATDLQAITREIKEVDQQRKALPSGDPFDSGYKRLHYCRYADDFAIGIIGSHADAEAVQENVKRFIQETLKLTVAEEKSSIRHSKDGVIFVGYWIGTYSGHRVVKMRRGTRSTTFKATSERIQVRIPPGKLAAFCTSKRYGNYATTDAIHRKELTILSDAEIILAYNQELRGLANYYALAQNAKREMSKLGLMWRGSLLKTLAAKHKISVTQVARSLKADDGYALVIRNEHRTQTIPIFRIKDLQPPPRFYGRVDIQPHTLSLTVGRSEIIQRANARTCEYCGKTDGPMEIHHIRKMKDVQRGKALWQRLMAARRRKTMVLCRRCHHLLHAGRLPARDHCEI